MVNAATNDAVKYALSKRIPVVIASRVYDGAVEPIYGGEGGSKTLLDEGCILAGDLIGCKARLLFMLGIAEYGNDVKRLKKLFR
jgi:L-asparaginase